MPFLSVLGNFSANVLSRPHAGKVNSPFSVYRNCTAFGKATVHRCAGFFCFKHSHFPCLRGISLPFAVTPPGHLKLFTPSSALQGFSTCQSSLQTHQQNLLRLFKKTHRRISNSHGCPPVYTPRGSRQAPPGLPTLHLHPHLHLDPPG